MKFRLEGSINPPPLVKTDLKDDNILAKLSQSQLTLIKHHYCLLKYAQVNVSLLSYAKTLNLKPSIRLTLGVQSTYDGFIILSHILLE